MDLTSKIVEDFKNGLSVNDLSKKYNFSKIKVEKIIKKSIDNVNTN